jgi:hypothetical protein
MRSRFELCDYFGNDFGSRWAQCDEFTMQNITVWQQAVRFSLIGGSQREAAVSKGVARRLSTQRDPK